MASDSARTAYNILINKGWTPAQASGMVGNLMAESGGNLNPREQHDYDKKQGRYTGVGIAGFRDPKPGQGRMTNLMNWSKSQGIDPLTLEAQVAFIDHELRTSEKSVGDRLRRATTPEEAAEAGIRFLRPQGFTSSNPRNGLNWSGRLANSQKIYSGLTGVAPALSTGPQPPTGSGALSSAPQDPTRTPIVSPEMLAAAGLPSPSMAPSGGSGGPGFLASLGADPGSTAGSFLAQLSDPANAEKFSGILGGGGPGSEGGEDALAGQHSDTHNAMLQRASQKLQDPRQTSQMHMARQKRQMAALSLPSPLQAPMPILRQSG